MKFKYDENVNPIHDVMLNNISNEYQKTEGFPTYDITRAMAFACLYLWNRANEVEFNQNVDNLEGEALSLYVWQRRGIERKRAIKAHGKIKVVEGRGIIKAGDLFQSDGGLQFVAIENKAVNNGDSFEAECTTAGVIGNVGAKVIKSMPITLQNISAVINEEAFQGGYDEESDNDLRARYYDDLRYPATSGNKYHYKKWALEVGGVGGADVISLWNGDNTVKVVIINSERRKADEELVKKVQNYIDPNKTGKGDGKAPIGAYCTVVSAREKIINLSLRAILKDDSEKENTRKAIEKIVTNYLKNIAFKQNYVSYAEIGALIIGLDNVIDYENFTLNNTKSKVAIASEEVAVLGSVILT